MWIDWALLAGGLVLLIAGGDLLVRGAVRIAASLGVSPLVIGLTLVGFGTSTPELVASVQAALAGAPGIAYGNIVGSNIANVLLIGGLAALVCPISVASSALRRDALAMLAVSLSFVVLIGLTDPGRAAGGAALALMAGYVIFAIRQERAHAGPLGHGALQDKAAALQDTDPALAVPVLPAPSRLPALLTALAGLALVLLGGRLLVDGAIGLARSLGLSEALIGLTIVAVGTSMPELVTSIMAGLRRQSDVAFGNIVGSNLYNILGIGGATALVAPGAVPDRIVSVDSLVMLAAALVLTVFAATGLRISRREGAVLLAGYIAYLGWAWL